MKTVLIFGGSGFVGRHIVRRIAKNGHKIIIPYQYQINEARLRLLGTTGQVVPIIFNSIKEEKIQNIISKADVIINLKTLWDQKKITFKKGILDFNVELVNSIKKTKNIQKFIYFSGIGTDNKDDSERSEAIHKSEQYIQKNLIDSIIVKSGVILGGNDQFLKVLLPLFKMFFFIPLFGKGLSKFQPIFIDDVSIAIDKIIESSLLGNHLFEFVGPDIFTYLEFYNYLSKCMNKTRVFVPIPFGIIKLVVSIMEKTPFSSINSEQLKLFENDNIATDKHNNLRDLEIYPQDLRVIIKNIVENNM